MGTCSSASSFLGLLSLARLSRLMLCSPAPGQPAPTAWLPVPCPAGMLEPGGCGRAGQEDAGAWGDAGAQGSPRCLFASSRLLCTGQAEVPLGHFGALCSRELLGFSPLRGMPLWLLGGILLKRLPSNGSLLRPGGAIMVAAGELGQEAAMPALAPGQDTAGARGGCGELPARSGMGLWSHSLGQSRQLLSKLLDVSTSTN